VTSVLVGPAGGSVTASGPAPRVEPGTSVRLRREPYGYLAYVGERDHFFAVAGPGADVLAEAEAATEAPHGTALHPAARALARFGIVRTTPPVAEDPHHGISLLGPFDGVPEVDRPLVVNCFATASCPLRCRYCYADDLMGPVPGRDRRDRVEAVAEMAAAVPAMVAVITGGEPLSRPDRTRALIDALGGSKSIVLDTSGVGGIEALLPVLLRFGVHLRVSLDSPDPAANDLLRPLAGRHRELARSSAAAVTALRVAAEAGLATTVQTVVTSFNDSPEGLLRTRDALVGRGVRNWVLHALVPAGKAAAARNAVLRPRPDVRQVLAEVVARSVADGTPLNIRVTGGGAARNAALLIGSDGRLFVEDDRRGKVAIAAPGDPAAHVLAAFRREVSGVGHAGRYLNGTLQPFSHRLVRATFAAGTQGE
jgi:MoaA/NifB/PqqE/SkfB family radical SAM enzyme